MAEGKDITESWKEKNYEEKYTELYFRVAIILSEANVLPIIPNVQRAFSAVKATAYTLIYNNKYLKEFEEHVKPSLETIEKVLYGKEDSDECLKAQAELGVIVEKDPKTKELKISNMQNIIHELYEIFFLVKQWSYEMGFFAKKPFDRKYGIKAIEDVMSM